MVTRISRKLEYDDRFALQQADQAIRKDVVRAIVELVTNSNDSYHVSEDAAKAPDGVIIVEVQRRYRNSLLRIRDHAEGISGDDMDKKVGTYGAETSGFKDGRSVRGLWGRGLKDAFFGLGYGSVYSFHDKWFNICSLSIKDGRTLYERQEPIRGTQVLHKQYGVPDGNGTVVEIVISRDDVRVPQFDNLRRMVERHFELRTIVSNPKRHVLLRELYGRGKVKQELQLGYKWPTGQKILDEVVEVPGFSATAHLQVYRSEVPLSTPAEEGVYADGGLLVIAKHVVLDLTLLKFENNEYAARFYGSVTCEYLYELLKKEPPEPVLTATRDGVSRTHPFTKALKTAIETRLDPLVEEERERLRAEERNVLNKKLRERVDLALRELNSIAMDELGTDNVINGPKPPFLPESGFGFVPEYVFVQTGKTAGLTLRAAVPDKVADGSLVKVESDTPEVVVLTPRVTIRTREDFVRIGQAQVEVEGRQVGAEAIVTATLNGLKAETFVKVISKREPPKQHRDTRRGGALFRDLRFDPKAEPRQRVRFEQVTADIIVATKAPSVAAYLDEAGNGHETPQGQVLLAELITEGVCREIARRGVNQGKFLAVAGAEADAIQREYIRLQNQYAHRVHKCFVDAEFRRDADRRHRRKGPPRREERLAKAVNEV